MSGGGGCPLEMDGMDDMDRMDGGDRKGRPYSLCEHSRGDRAHPLICLWKHPRGKSAPTRVPLYPEAHPNY